MLPLKMYHPLDERRRVLNALNLGFKIDLSAPNSYL